MAAPDMAIILTPLADLAGLEVGEVVVAAAALVSAVHQVQQVGLDLARKAVRGVLGASKARIYMHLLLEQAVVVLDL